MQKLEQLKLYGALSAHDSDWKRIARASHCEESNDIAHSAFAYIIEEWKGDFDINNQIHWNAVKAIMYNRFVAFAEKNLMYATRIDQPSRHDPDAATHPLFNEIKAAEYTEPLQQLIEQENQHEDQIKLDQEIKNNSYSKLIAFWIFISSLAVLKRIEQAALMNMSVSWLNRCLYVEATLKNSQPTLFDSVEPVPHKHQLKSWRKFKLTSLKSAPESLLNQQMRLF